MNRRSVYSSQHGFTAVEMAAVAVISGMLLAFTLPAVVRYRGTMKTVQIREQVIQDLRAARQKAVTRHSQVIVAFGNGTATTNVMSYKVHTDLNGDKVVQSGELVINRTLPSETRIASITLTPTDTLIFDISGVLTPSCLGGTLVVATNSALDTLVVSAAGMVHKQ